MSKVRVGARAIAAGYAENKLRVTLSLMPHYIDSADKDGAALVELRDWPKEIHEWASSGKFMLELWPVAPGAKPEEAIKATSAKLGLYRPTDKLDAGRINELWREVVERASQGGEQFKGAKDAKNAGAAKERFWDVLAKVFDVSGAVKRLPATVFRTARSDAALLHLKKRIDGIFARVAPGKGDARQPALPDGGAFDGTASWDEVEPLPDRFTEKLDMYKSAPPGDGKTSSLPDAYFESARAAEREKIEKAVSGLKYDANSIDDVRNKGEVIEAETRNLHLAALLDDIASGDSPLGVTRRLPAAGGSASTSESAPPTPLDDSVARTLMSAIRNSPMLSRLFHFVVDFDFDFDFGAKKWLRKKDSDSEYFAYVCLGATANGAAGGLTVYTLAKATFDSGQQIIGFWPVTQEEIAEDASLAAVREKGVASQIGGVVDLGQCKGAPYAKEYNPRFDIVGIDPVHAMEAASRNAQRAKSLGESAARMKKQASQIGETARSPFSEEEMGLVSRGLSIVDRWRAKSVFDEIEQARTTPPDGVTIIDADDLTIGYRVDVVVRSGQDNAPLPWRSLMEREINYLRFGAPLKAKDEFIGWFEQLSLSPRGAELKYDADRRRDYDAGMLLPMARRRRREKDEVVHAEETIAAWEGDPLGLNCHSDTIFIENGADVGIDRHFTLPSGDHEESRKTWPLRYGWAYRFGIRPVWLGGVCLPLREASRRYDASAKDLKNLALPGSSTFGKIPVAGWSRCLRYERIHAPVVMLPAVLAAEHSDYASQSGTRVILRSLSDDAAWPDKPAYVDQYSKRIVDQTWRVVLPPQVSLDEAVRHGSFDPYQGKDETPPGDLLEVNYDADLGDRRIGSLAPAKKNVSPQARGFPAIERRGDDGAETTPRDFEDYFETHAAPVSPGSRKGAAQQYYADPMADWLVFAVRKSVSRQYFPGSFIAVPVGRDANGGAIRATVVKFERALKGKRPATPQKKDFWIEGKQAFVDGKQIHDKTKSGAMAANLLTLRIHAGEDLAVDCWFAPSVEKLRAYFAWPEVAAVEAAYSATAQTREAIIEALCGAVGGKPGADPGLDKAKRDALARYGLEPAWVGAAGQVADPATIAVAAKILHDHLTSRGPIPEISAVRVVHATHAVARPTSAPAFRVDGRFMALRCKSLSREDALKDLPSWSDPKFEKAAEERRFGAHGDDGVVFVGAVDFDRSEARQLEVRVFSTTPARTVLDDVGRGRTSLQRLLGEWRDDITKPIGEARTALDIFGFDVDTRGRVRFPRQTVTLLQLDEVEIVGDNGGAGFALDLARIQAARADKKLRTVDGLRSGAQDFYSDRFARKFFVHLRSTTRFDPYFVRLTKDEKSLLPETQFPPVSGQLDLITRSSHEESGVLAIPSSAPRTALQTIWLPATIAPAKPNVHAALPAFDIKRPPTRKAPVKPDVWTYNRRPTVRIYLDRPWFTSGEGERLGVVVWPPYISALRARPNDVARLKAGAVPRQALYNSPEGGAGQLMALDNFVDDDLGPGGKFVTRWGLDPIRNISGDTIGTPPLGPFIPPEAFRDLNDKNVDTDDEEAIVYVPNVTIPLIDIREDAKRKLGPDDTMVAALITYAPRFDVESEKWFVDIAINPDRAIDPFVRFGLVRYQPNAAPELQVSTPTLIWSQIYPHRGVAVRTRRVKDEIVLDVDVLGYTAGRHREGRQDDELEHPQIRISVISCSTTQSAMISERFALQRRDGKVSQAVQIAKLGTPTIGDAFECPRSWNASFSILGSSVPGGDVAVLVEELEEFLSTADERPLDDSAKIAPEIVEPKIVSGGVVDYELMLDEKPPPGTALSGPRFLARLDIAV